MLARTTEFKENMDKSRMRKNYQSPCVGTTAGVLLSILLLFSVSGAKAAPKSVLVMPSLFSDNMVLQQKSVVPVWGKGEPGQKIYVAGSWGAEAKTAVRLDSSWEVRLRTVKAGGPYVLNVTAGDSTIRYTNVMLGEVWVCSGQSNMQMPLAGWPPLFPLNNASEEIRKAEYPDIRLFTASPKYAVTPQSDCSGSWTECTPKTAAEFSAVGYFFGRKLYSELHVPIGLIWSVWGGTEIQPWIGAKYLSRMASYKDKVETIENSSGLISARMKWIYSHPVLDVASKAPQERWKGLDFDDIRCPEVNYNDSLWRSVKLPDYWIYNYENRDGRFIGAVWFRKKVNIPKSWLDSTLVLDLGPIGGMDETWVNGTKVGGILERGYDASPRVYDIPGSVVDDTILTVAIRVPLISSWGGIWGNNVPMEVHPQFDSTQTVSLSGAWKFMPVAQYLHGKYYVFSPDGEIYSRPKLPFAYSENTPTVLYNGMIAPLIPYRIRGVIWYQGESNTNEPYDYKNLFPLMIKDWRAAWGEGDFPFYWVQIAPYHYGKEANSEVIRNAQRETLSLPHTGMAVTLDIGTPGRIHPPDKQDVGLRLALWALAKQYGENVVYSGPLYRSMKVRGDKVMVSFSHASGGLVFKPLDGDSNFIIAGKDSVFVVGKVKVEGRTLVVYSPRVKHPIAVRYAWGNAQEATLFNKAGLPASTFKTDHWRR